MESGFRSLNASTSLISSIPQAEASGDQGFWLTEHQVGDEEIGCDRLLEPGGERFCQRVWCRPRISTSRS